MLFWTTLSVTPGVDLGRAGHADEDGPAPVPGEDVAVGQGRSADGVPLRGRADDDAEVLAVLAAGGPEGAGGVGAEEVAGEDVVVARLDHAVAWCRRCGSRGWPRRWPGPGRRCSEESMSSASRVALDPRQLDLDDGVAGELVGVGGRSGLAVAVDGGAALGQGRERATCRREAGDGEGPVPGMLKLIVVGPASALACEQGRPQGAAHWLVGRSCRGRRRCSVSPVVRDGVDRVGPAHRPRRQRRDGEAGDDGQHGQRDGCRGPSAARRRRGVAVHRRAPSRAASLRTDHLCRPRWHSQRRAAIW